jgi:hypothetical protein
MKQIITAAIVFLLFTITASAQKRKCGTDNGGRKGHRKEMGQKLNLSETQKQQAKQYKANYQAQIKALNSNDKITLGEYNAKKAALQQQHKSEMQTLLTPEQKQQMETAKTARKLKHTERQEKRMAKMKAQLGLNDTQMNALKANKEKAKTSIEKIKTDNSLTQEQKKAQIKELKKANKEQFLSSLSSEQKQKLEAKKQHKKEQKEVSK